MKYDYLIVGSGLFGSTCANLLNKKGKKVLISILKILKELMYINMALIYFIQIIKMYGIM